MIELFLILSLSVVLVGLARVRLFSAMGIFAVYFLAGVVTPYLLYRIAGFRVDNTILPMERLPIDLAFGYMVLGLLGVIAAFTITRRLATAPDLMPTLRNDRLLSFLSVGAILSGIIYFAIVVSVTGSLSEALFLAQRRARVESSLYNFALIFSFSAQVYGVFAFHLMAQRGNWRSLSGALVVGAVVTALLIAFASGGRSITVLLLIAFSWDRLVRLKSAQVAAVATLGAIGIAGLSKAVLELRYAAQGSAKAGSLDFAEIATTGLAFVDHMGLAIDYAAARGHSYGESYVNALGLIIPRDLWPDKPLQISILFREFFFGDIAGGVPPGWFGEAYVAFGVLGVVIAGLVLGFLIGRLDNANDHIRHTDAPLIAAATGFLVPLVSYALVRGGFDIGAIRIGIPAFFCLTVFWADRFFKSFSK